jgi:hypothetical protein
MSPSRRIRLSRGWHERGRLKCAALAALLAIAMPAAAVERIRLRAAQVAVGGASVQQLDAQLAIESATRSTLTLHTGGVQLPAAIASQVDANAGALNGITLQCRDMLIRTPKLACPALRVTLHTSRWRDLAIAARLDFDTAKLALQARGDGPPIAGVTPRFDFSGTAGQWRANVDLPAAQVTAWLPVLRTWLALPADITVSGKAGMAIQATGHDSLIDLDAQIALTDGGFQNAAYTWAGEKLAVNARIKAALREPLTFDVQLSGDHGQSLTGPVLLNFDKNPLQLRLRGAFTSQAVRIESFDSQQKDLAHITGSAQLGLAPFSVAAAQINAREIHFPAAYASYLQLSLATTPFNQLTTRGTVAAQLRMAANQPVALTLGVDDLALSDAAQHLDVTGVKAELHWASGDAEPERPSWLAWDSARGWGMEGARSRLDFATHDRDFRLLQPARLPLFDGALRINTLAVRKLGLPDMAGDFDAVIEPISVTPIAKALGWPEFAGTLSGRIPGVTYRNRELSLQGDVDAQVFDGRVTASHLRVRDPFGDWPRLYADITARNLDLELITRTFEFGSITGRLDVDALGLETFGTSPVAFDLKVGTPRNDRSRHRISQRAVQNLSKIGGGGATAALQSGLLRFFEQFGYSRLGLGCRLRDDVCQMSGIEPVSGGFYLMKGSGIPKLDIIGHNGRVAWLVFLSQVRDAMANPENINVGRP